MNRPVPMVILAADTSTAANTVALAQDDRPIAEIAIHTDHSGGRRHSERLLALLDLLLNETSTKLDAVDLLTIATGPGSFTGLRIGVAAWKGLALAGRKKLLGVPTLAAMSRNVTTFDGIVCPVLDARMNEVYAAAYSYEGGTRTELAPPCVAPVKEFVATLPSPALFLGDAVDTYRDEILAQMPDARFAPPTMHLPRASSVAAEAFDLYKTGADTDPARVAPIYLREANALTLRERQERAARKAAAKESSTKAGVL